jgi:hypothetical protein
LFAVDCKVGNYVARISSGTVKPSNKGGCTIQWLFCWEQTSCLSWLHIHVHVLYSMQQSFKKSSKFNGALAQGRLISLDKPDNLGGHQHLHCNASLL